MAMGIIGNTDANRAVFKAPDNTTVEVIRLEGYRIGLFSFEPGWRSCGSIKPSTGAMNRRVAHQGYAVSGRIRIRMDDGSQRTVTPGMCYAIAPGHDAWVEGNEPFIGMESLGAAQYA